MLLYLFPVIGEDEVSNLHHSPVRHNKTQSNKSLIIFLYIKINIFSQKSSHFYEFFYVLKHVFNKNLKIIVHFLPILFYFTLTNILMYLLLLSEYSNDLIILIMSKYFLVCSNNTVEGTNIILPFSE